MFGAASRASSRSAVLAPHNAASLLSLPPARLWGGNIPLALPRVLFRQGSPPKSIYPNSAASPTAAAAAVASCFSCCCFCCCCCCSCCTCRFSCCCCCCCLCLPRRLVLGWWVILKGFSSGEREADQNAAWWLFMFLIKTTIHEQTIQNKKSENLNSPIWCKHKRQEQSPTKPNTKQAT